HRRCRGAVFGEPGSDVVVGGRHAIGRNAAVTAAQALTPGLGAPSSAGRASNGGSASERGGASFRDALDGASKGTSEARGRARTSSDQRSAEAESSTGPTAQDAGALTGTPPGQA